MVNMVSCNVIAQLGYVSSILLSFAVHRAEAGDKLWIDLL